MTQNNKIILYDLLIDCLGCASSGALAISWTIVADHSLRFFRKTIFLLNIAFLNCVKEKKSKIGH